MVLSLSLSSNLLWQCFASLSSAVAKAASSKESIHLSTLRDGYLSSLATPLCLSKSTQIRSVPSFPRTNTMRAAYSVCGSKMTFLGRILTILAF